MARHAAGFPAAKPQVHGGGRGVHVSTEQLKNNRAVCLYDLQLGFLERFVKLVSKNRVLLP